MDHTSEYNVEGGLLSLGENIFLEILSEMQLPQDVRQFLILNKKTFKIILHPRYAKIIQSIIQISPGIGIADTSCSFAAGKAPWDDEKGNQKYANGQSVAVEVDMTTVPRRATFFVDDIEQPNFVIGIPSDIRFLVYTFEKFSSFTITKFERLIQSTAKGVEEYKALEWGKKWK
ncbi:MAG: hypothetical protein EZS28_004468 [Streblomastix strix]|uniref:Uncharacterized protein n=1 Tax=Streblomastix strix TaxID=222440 RepID=A0A5J4WYT6_9EUKA|nr:MAG: hypothetical protein EZS28_004468 [Streblomastix strix]